MNCPIDGAELKISERQGIEIDYCPQCRGVWLDRGELDKIIERSAAHSPSSAPARIERDDDRDDYRRRDDYYEPKKKKRGSFLDDLFDF